MNLHAMHNKKVLLTTSHTDVGSGGSMQMFLLAKGLCEAGATVHVLFKQSKRGKTPKLDLYKTIDAKVGFFRPNRWWSPIQILKMRARLKREKYDIVHTHKGGDLSLILFASARIKIPVLVNTRGVSFALGLNRFKYNAKRLDRAIVVSKQSKQVMIDCGVKPDKIEVIYGGVDTERFAPIENGERVREEFGIPIDAPLFVVIANLVRQKGHDDYLQAAALLEKTDPGCYHLFAGSGDPAKLIALAAQHKIGDRVIFAGYRKDVPDLFAAATASVFPGFAGEGVSGVLRESLACKVPVITTDVGGNAEIVEDEIYGLVVPMRHPDMLAIAMQRILTNPAFAAKIADQGYEYILQEHSVQSRNGRIFDLYGKLADN